MITVRSLHVYPVKSCRGIDLLEAEVVATGFLHDRQWMVIGTDGAFLSQRNHPVLARVGTKIDGDLLTLEGPNLPPLEIALSHDTGDRRSVRVWTDTCEATTAGPEAGEWFSSLLGTACELVRQPEDGIRRVDQRFAVPGDRVAFADGYPFLLVSRPSVEDLNQRLENEVPTNRFRANIVIDGCNPYAEDTWTSLAIAEVGFRVAKPCARCVVIATDQQDGTRSREPLKTLASYRRVGDNVLFGQNLIHDGCGRLRVGDEVTVLAGE